MIFSVVTIFPGMIRDLLQYGLLAKAVERGIIRVDAYDLRDFTRDKHRKVDDRPFGGGPGMVMKPAPLFRAVDHISRSHPGRVVLFSAYAPILSQERVKKLAAESHLILVCGRYEGVDQRFIDQRVDEEISIGPYVLMGGELAAAVVLESTARMLAGVIGNAESVITDSHYEEGQVGWPQYTQPRDFQGLPVPEVLLSGNHREIDEWRRKNSFRPRTGTSNIEDID
ncbi:MAG: tRNA (guanosine(37)-N1)-methyltransferase TrmD [Acidobacteriota bacterium]|jgi:tRNA (guanine37-N1)-methyltransferase|nr:tRNA (guanosine(37)-N1)-methyltransferase TrmD [Acidobacteriota bacterium]